MSGPAVIRGGAGGGRWYNGASVHARRIHLSTVGFEEARVERTRRVDGVLSRESCMWSAYRTLPEPWQRYFAAALVLFESRWRRGGAHRAGTARARVPGARAGGRSVSTPPPPHGRAALRPLTSRATRSSNADARSRARSLRSLRIELHFPNLFKRGSRRRAVRRTRLICSDENLPQFQMAAASSTSFAVNETDHHVQGHRSSIEAE